MKFWSISKPATLGSLQKRPQLLWPCSDLALDHLGSQDRPGLCSADMCWLCFSACAPCTWKVSANNSNPISSNIHSASIPPFRAEGGLQWIAKACCHSKQKITKSIMAYKNDLTPFGTLHIIAVIVDCFGSWSSHTLKVKCAGLGAIPQWEWQVRPSSTILPLRQQQGGIRSVGSGLGDHRQIHLENHKLCKVTNCNIITLEEQLGTAVVVVIFIPNNIYGPMVFASMLCHSTSL